MNILGLTLVGVGILLFVWWLGGFPQSKTKDLSASPGLLVEGKVVYLNEWLHEGHRRCQVEYVYEVHNPENNESKILRGQSNCLPQIFDTLELNVPLKVRYLPQNPEFSRPLFEN